MARTTTDTQLLKKLRGHQLGYEPPGARGIILKTVHPRTVADSPWTSRYESTYDSVAYLDLKHDLKVRRVNHIPVLVRPNPDYRKPGAKASGTPRWQLVYGELRKKACLELDIRMNVIVQKLTDAQAIQKAHAENNLRCQPSVFERGLFYCSSLKSGQFGSLREQAAHLNVSVSEVSRATFLASLPVEVLQTMKSPTDILTLDADKLRPIWDKNPFELLMRADEINETDGPLSAKEAILRLTRPETENVAGCNTATSIPLQVGDRFFGQLNVSAAGLTNISFNRPLSKSILHSLQSAILDFGKIHIEEL